MAVLGSSNPPTIAGWGKSPNSNAKSTLALPKCCRISVVRSVNPLVKPRLVPSLLPPAPAERHAATQEVKPDLRREPSVFAKDDAEVTAPAPSVAVDAEPTQPMPAATQPTPAATATPDPVKASSSAPAMSASAEEPAVTAPADELPTTQPDIPKTAEAPAAKEAADDEPTPTPEPVLRAEPEDAVFCQARR